MPYKLPGARFLDIHWRGWVSFAGSLGLYVLLGYVYLWGFIGGVVTSYFHYQGDKDVRESQAELVIPYGMLAMAVLNPLGPILFKYLNIKVLVFLGLGVLIGCLALAVGTTKTFVQFEYYWIGGMSMGMALLYTTVMMSAW